MGAPASRSLVRVTATVVTVTAANTLAASDTVTLSDVAVSAANNCTSADVTALDGGTFTVATASAKALLGVQLHEGAQLEHAAGTLRSLNSILFDCREDRGGNGDADTHNAQERP